MGPFEMVVVIVLISVGAGVINNWLKVKAEQADSGTDQATKDKIASLEERVQTLEALVTDSRHRLHREFDRL